MVGAGFAALLILVSGAVSALVGSSNGADETDQDSAAQTAATGSDAVATTCRTRVAAAGVLVSAARTGIAHLEVHVGARGDLAVGDLAEDRESPRYQATELAGSDDLARYADAQQAYDDVVADAPQACPARQSDCARRLRALTASIEAGAPGMALWEERTADLADETSGVVDADRAQELWDEVRAAVPPTLADWRDTERALERAPECA